MIDRGVKSVVAKGLDYFLPGTKSQFKIGGENGSGLCEAKAQPRYGDVDSESHVKRVTKMNSFDYKEVCHFCYKLSSHKTKPTYTPRSKVIKGKMISLFNVII